MTEKQFDLVCDDVEWWMQSGIFLPIKNKNTNERITLKQCLDLLNSLEQDEQLKQQNKMLRTNVGKLTDDATTHQKENEQLKKENKELKNDLNLLKLTLKEKNYRFDKNHKMYMEQIEENKELKHKIVKIFENGLIELFSDKYKIIEDISNE